MNIISTAIFVQMLIFQTQTFSQAKSLSKSIDKWYSGREDITLTDVFDILKDQNRERHRAKRGKYCPRIRKEVRRLRKSEWKRFSQAVNILKQKGVYDQLAAIHRGMSTIFSAHFGPNFLGWHRIYLLLFEEFLRREDPCISIPYWDSTLDFHMADPTKSVLWTDEFFGNGDGYVTNGPFANWTTGQGDRLIRNFGAGGFLISKENVARILRRNNKNHSHITDSLGRPEDSIEMFHNGPHVWVDGHMSLVASTAEDPIFFLHHSFVDCWWQKFREKIYKRHGVDSYDDYPYAKDEHAPGRLMDPFSAFEPFLNITNRDAYRNKWGNLYKCERFPYCRKWRKHCRSDHLYCETFKSRPRYRCISKAVPYGSPKEIDLAVREPFRTDSGYVSSTTTAPRPVLRTGIRFKIPKSLIDTRASKQPLVQENSDCTDVKTCFGNEIGTVNLTKLDFSALNFPIRRKRYLSKSVYKTTL